MNKDEMMSLLAYHTVLRGLIMSMEKPGREMTIGNTGDNKEPQMIFAEVPTGPVRSITLEPRLLYALANSVNFRLLIEDEILRCEEECAKEGVDIYVPKEVEA